MLNIPSNITEWLEINNSTLLKVRDLLAEKLSDNPVLLTQQLTTIEAWQGRLSTMQAECDSLLDLAELRELTNLDSDLKALEREVRLKANVVNERRIRDICLGLNRAISGRIILGMSLIKTYSTTTPQTGGRWQNI